MILYLVHFLLAKKMNHIFILLSLICINTALETPIIGILSQETYIVDSLFPGETYDSFIAASYVKYLESAGARVVPIWIGQDEQYYRRVVNYTNGMFFPGGGTYFNETGGYGEAAKKIYELSIEANNRGVYYPIWGTCLGLQVLVFAEVGKDIRISCSSRRRSLPLHFKKGFEKSKIFSYATEETINLLKSKNITYNNHQFCITENELKNEGILSSWKLLSTNVDDNNLEFISTMESVDYPIYGVQFHPEKNRFEFKKSMDFPHTTEAVKISQYFANFFVEETRKNNNSFPSDEIEKQVLIYNYNPRYTGELNSSYEQIYVFKKEDFNTVHLI